MNQLDMCVGMLYKPIEENLPMDTSTIETVPPAQPLNSKWYEIWLDVWAHPGEEAFRGILKERDHSIGRAFIWVAITSLVIAIASIIGYVPLYKSLVSQIGPVQSFEFFNTTTIFTFGLCSVILAPISAILGLVISTGIYHLISRLFGGSGAWSDLVFCMAAVTAPASIISGILMIPYLLFGNFPAIWWLVAIFIGILSVVVAVYVLVMNVNAIRAAEQIGTWQSVLTIFLPIIIVGVLTVCCVSLTIPSIISSSVR
ncbi:MAG: DUF1282 domain-containing protein [Anaerolineae bacterium]|nr:DUF1282 domain-containing protein [Anaerolineae bacterium]